MDKKLIIILICGLIIFIVYLFLDKNMDKKEIKKELEHEFIDFEAFNQKNNIAFDPYTFYTKNNKLDDSNNKIKYTKENFDFDYESDFKYNDELKSKNRILNYKDKNLQAQSVPKLSQLKKTAIYLETEPTNNKEQSPNWTTYNESNQDEFLVPNDLESNSIFSMPFPENTSIELANFTAENVADLFDADNMGDLYNNINGDVYRGYKTLKYML